MAIERGPLVFALPIETEWKKVKDRNLPFDDWEVYPKSPWNYALQIDREHPERSVTFEERASRRGRRSHATGAPVIARVKGRRCPAGVWKKEPPLRRRESRRQQGAAGRIDADSLRLHRPAGHRVPNPGLPVR